MARTSWRRQCRAATKWWPSRASCTAPPTTRCPTSCPPFGPTRCTRVRAGAAAPATQEAAAPLHARASPALARLLRKGPSLHPLRCHLRRVRRLVRVPSGGPAQRSAPVPAGSQGGPLADQGASCSSSKQPLRQARRAVVAVVAAVARRHSASCSRAASSNDGAGRPLTNV